MVSFLSMLHSYSDWGLLVMRLCIGAIFLYHCRSKFAQLGSFMGYVGIVELLGGLGEILGFLTQFASMGLAVIMLGAMYKKYTQWHVPFSAQDKMGWEFDLMIFGACIALVTLGGGALSLDRMMWGW